jgi:nicotine blue oxidoreductase
MGRPKALLRAGSETFLERTISALIGGGCADVVVVLNDDDSELLNMTSAAGGRPAWGAGIGSEQIDSLRSGLRALAEGVDAVVVLPVDHPLVRPTTVAAVITAYRGSGAAVVQVLYDGKNGHPVLFDAALFNELLFNPLEEGARSMIRAHASEAIAIEVDDPGVLIDVDTPEEYERYLGEAE